MYITQYCATLDLPAELWLSSREVMAISETAASAKKKSPSRGEQSELFRQNLETLRIWFHDRNHCLLEVGRTTVHVQGGIPGQIELDAR